MSISAFFILADTKNTIFSCHSFRNILQLTRFKIPFKKTLLKLALFSHYNWNKIQYITATSCQNKFKFPELTRLKIFFLQSCQRSRKNAKLGVRTLSWTIYPLMSATVMQLIVPNSVGIELDSFLRAKVLSFFLHTSVYTHRGYL